MDDALHYLLYNATKALSPFMQRESYLYWPFILSAIVIAAALWRRPWRAFWREYFSPQVWFHRSAIADYWLYFANALLIPALFVFLVVDERQLHSRAGYDPFHGFHLSGGPVMTVSRGEIVARDGQITSRAGRGQHLERHRTLDRD